MVRVNTILVALCALALGVACTSPAQQEPAPEAPKATLRRALGEGPAALMADVGVKAEAALVRSPRSLVAAGTTLLFSAVEDSIGEELWRQDPTGPVLVADIYPGAVGSGPSQLFHMRGLTYFTAVDTQHGVELWRTDGTSRGTYLLKDIFPGNKSSGIRTFTEYNGWLFFVANDGVNGLELWRSDGTPEGTELVRDIVLGSGGGAPSGFTVFGGKLYFLSTGPGGTRQLWRTDGTGAGTVRVSTKVTASSADGELVRVGGSLFFAGTDGTTGLELWKTNGTEAGTVRVKDIRPGTAGSEPQKLTAFGGALYFAATDGTSGYELWRSDGTEEGTRLVTELVPGNNTAEAPSRLVATRTHLFIACVNSTQSALYATDGTAGGTVKVVDFKALGGSGQLYGMTAQGDTLFFFGHEPAVGTELWKSDGTASGTRRIGTDLFPNNGPLPAELTVVGDTVYFMANTPGTGLTPEFPAIPTLWKTQGDESTTVPAGAEPKPNRGSNPGPFASMGGALYFTTFDEEEVPRLWRSDGTAAGTLALADVGVKGMYTSGASGLSELTVLKDQLFFGVWKASANQLWKTDGTTDGTVRVTSNVQLASEVSYPMELHAHNGELFFAGKDATNDIELWKTDGTSDGTVRVKDISPGSTQSSSPFQFTSVGGDLYFLVTAEGTAGWELWKTDGTSAGTVRAADIRGPAGTPSVTSIVGAMDGSLYVVAADATTGPELWRLDGSGTATRVKDIRPGSLGSGPAAFAVIGTTLYFTAQDDEAGRELWRTDGTEAGTWRVKDIAAGTASASPAAFAVIGTTLYFTADDGGSGRELWRSDGTEAGTVRVIDVRPGSAHGVLAESLFVLPTEKVLLFAANDGVNGTELWRSDGTEAGTFVLHDIAPGQLSSEPASFTFHGGSIVFGANDGRHGREPWLMSRALLTNSTPPTISCPANQFVEAQQPLGALVHLPEAEAHDDTELPPALSYSHGPSGFFLFGTTQVTATARDTAGLVATCDFTVTVRDTLPPEPVCPGDATVEATGLDGAVVTFPDPVASDAVTRAPGITVDPASDKLFAQGATKVTVTATDSAGNSNQCTFTVHVRDTTASVVSCPANQIFEAVDAGGATATWPAAAASDVASLPTVSYDHVAGSRFPLGSTPVTATATDGAGNLSSCTFQVIVRDTTVPTLKCPAAIQVEATGPSGAPADFAVTNAVDTISDVTVETSHASGSTFPVGETSVQVRAEDASGNASECSFPIVVRDTLPPLLTCPQDVSVTPGSKGAAAVELPQASVTDRVTTSPTVTMSPESGSRFQPGDTAVEVTAKDAAGNTARCSFNVHVENVAGGCSSAPGPTSPLAWVGLLLLVAVAARRRSFSSRGL
jgi:MYXO-CTERM domain-containing protein